MQRLRTGFLQGQRQENAMTITYLPQARYTTMPWKNGTGSTDEIFLLPPCASRDVFDLRISRAVISTAGAFSAFPGVDRTITLIEGSGLKLDFGDRVIDLEFCKPYTFDSGLTPVGIPAEGRTRVLNVMAARNIWRLAPARILSAKSDLQPIDAAPMVMFVIRGTVVLTDSSGSMLLHNGDTALLDSPAEMNPAEDTAVLCVGLAASKDA